jgi:hypothetical protein
MPGVARWANGLVVQAMPLAREESLKRSVSVMVFNQGFNSSFVADEARPSQRGVRKERLAGGHEKGYELTSQDPTMGRRCSFASRIP